MYSVHRWIRYLCEKCEYRGGLIWIQTIFMGSRAFKSRHKIDEKNKITKKLCGGGGGDDNTHVVCNFLGRLICLTLIHYERTTDAKILTSNSFSVCTFHGLVYRRMLQWNIAHTGFNHIRIRSSKHFNMNEYAFCISNK